ncbi:MAG TPA: flavin reductase family protein [candidate division Zixibacteria bacterium]|nr:flavin reductase family protein [candidate division Zixibacteria bacterium]
MQDIKKILRKLEYGVYVVTMGKGTEGNAFTASWVMQVSSEPPMLALAVHNAHQSMPLIKDNSAFAVNLIGEGQDGVAKAYYGPAESGYRKLEGSSVKDSPATKTPLIPGAIGFFDCKVVRTVEAGNHTIFIGEIQAAELEAEDTQLMTSTNSKLHYTG